MPRLNFLLKEKFPSILWLTKKEKNLYWNQLIYVFENIRKIYRAHSPSISFLEKALFIIAHFERPHSINDMSNCKIRGSFLQISCLAAGGHRKKRGNRYTFNRLFSIQCAFECRFAAISVTVSERTFSEYKYIISHLSVCGVCVCVFCERMHATAALMLSPKYETSRKKGLLHYLSCVRSSRCCVVARETAKSGLRPFVPRPAQFAWTKETNAGGARCGWLINPPFSAIVILYSK